MRDRGRDRELASPAFPDDDGAADEALVAALASRDGYAVMAALTGARLLVPVVAVLGELAIDEHGRAHDKTADMATVLVTGADGRTALLAFTSLATLHAWRPDARPVPVSARDAARAALQDGADAIVIDLAGPTA
ncbi:MAG: SseB family protein, partial [Nocardioides sp.]|uniref:SseB family protein n=1 Tax=Nocardioides sp. TaxID=35761 RepID=UPI0039E67EBB